jgi:uncharacterized membrane protein YkvA (DUF1232 family)
MEDVNDLAQKEKDILDRVEADAIENIDKRVAIYKKDEKQAERDANYVKENLFHFIERIGKKLAKGIIDSIKFLYNAMVDPRTPIEAKLIAIAALIYLISPFDIIPDIIPGIGFADDAAAITAAVASISVILLKHGIHLEEDKVQ